MKQYIVCGRYCWDVADSRAMGATGLDFLTAFLHRWQFLIHFLADHPRDVIMASCHKSFISHVVVFAFL
jgi:hypothetical protein